MRQPGSFSRERPRLPALRRELYNTKSEWYRRLNPMNSTVAEDLNLDSSDKDHRPGWLPRNIWRMRRLFQCSRMAGASLFACVPMLLARRPETPLRLLCIGAFEYLARVQGRRLDDTGRRALACACDFGALRNDFYDQRELDRGAYRELRHNLRHLAPEKATLHYIHALRAAERGRPSVGREGDIEAASIVEYRNRVLVISLAWLRGISGGPLHPHLFQALLGLAGLAQLVDDLLDYKDDWACRRPTYVTAFLSVGAEPSRDAMTHLHFHANRFRNLLVAASERQSAAAPLALAGAFMWLLAVALLKVRFRR